MKGTSPSQARCESSLRALRNKPSRTLNQPKTAQVFLQLSNGAPRQNRGVRPLVGWVGRQFIGPPAAADQWKQRPFVQPGQVNLGFGTCTAANDDASIAGKGHQEITGIPHTTGQHHRRGPVRRRHMVRRNDAEHQTVGLNRPLGGDSGGGAAAPAHNGNAEFRQRFTRFPGKLISARTGIGAAEYTDLGFSVRSDHVASLRPDVGTKGSRWKPHPDGIGQRMAGERIPTTSPPN